METSLGRWRGRLTSS